MNSVKLTKMNSGQAFRILHEQYQSMQLYLRNKLFLKCMDDSAGTGYCPHIMLRPKTFVEDENGIDKCFKELRKKTLLEQKYARSLIQNNMFMVSVPHFFFFFLGGGTWIFEKIF